MKTILLLILGFVTAMIVLANLGPMILLAISLLISYYGVKKFILADSVMGKVFWGFAILIALGISLSNIPALIGVASFIILYYTYKMWKKEKQDKLTDNDYMINLD